MACLGTTETAGHPQGHSLRAAHDGVEISLHDELMRLKALRDGSKSLREMSEWCVEIEEAMGGRPPTRPFDCVRLEPEKGEQQ
jgi:hypothetical protein